MKFRNKTSDALYSDKEPRFSVEPGEDLVLTADEAAGFVLQCGDGGNWEPSDDDAKAAVAAATDPPATKAAAKKATVKETSA